MLSHLRGDRHGEIVVAVSRHVPIVIRRVALNVCHLCPKTFRLKFALRKHVRQGHGEKQYVLPNHERLTCQHCTFATYTQKSLTSHSFLAHPESRSKYNCHPCRLQFHSKKSAELHRRCQTHKSAARERRRSANGEDGGGLEIKCSHCGECVADHSALKVHISKEHRNAIHKMSETSQCGVCGVRFALPQDLGVHVRRGICSAAAASVSRVEPNNESVGGQLICGEEDCRFTCESLNMFLFHQSLAHTSVSSSTDGVRLFRCAVCFKTLSRPRLWEHVRVHGDASRCGQCYRTFASDDRLARHVEVAHTGAGTQVFRCDQCDYVTSKSDKLLQLHRRRTHFKPEQCKICDKVLATHRSFQSHQKSHREKKREDKYVCDHAGCSYRGSDMSGFKKHLLCHSDKDLQCDSCEFRCKRTYELSRHKKKSHSEDGARSLRCDRCEYSTASRQHLNRHVKTHSKDAEEEEGGGMVFQCRLCSFKCSSLDSVRKHIIKTTRHPGEAVYACDNCDGCDTNSAAEYRRHVETEHDDVFKTPFDALSHVRDYFVVADD